jgi:hypothetical protein
VIVGDRAAVSRDGQDCFQATELSFFWAARPRRMKDTSFVFCSSFLSALFSHESLLSSLTTTPVAQRQRHLTGMFTYSLIVPKYKSQIQSVI